MTTQPMTKAEAVTLCRFAKAACPQQAFDTYTPDAWAELLGDLCFADAKLAVIELAKRQPFVAPAEIRTEVRRIRAARITAYGTLPDPPAGLDPDNAHAYQRWLEDTTKRIADGNPPPRALGTGDDGQAA